MIDRDLLGQPASRDLRQTPKNYGKRKIVGVIRNGKYVDPETGELIVLSKKKIDAGKTIRINQMGGVE